MCVTQGGSPGVSQEEKGVREVFGEPRGRTGEPEQNPHRGAQSPQRLVLPQIRIERPTTHVQRLRSEPHPEATPPFLGFLLSYKKNPPKKLLINLTVGITET